MPQVQSLDLGLADKDAYERAVRANYGSADHEVAIVIHNAGTLGQDGRKITVSFLVASSGDLASL